jgi:hypothetical protein
MAIELTTATPETLLELRTALSAMGSVGNETIQGVKTFSQDLQTNSRFLSGGVDLADIFITSQTDNQLLAFNDITDELIITGGNSVFLNSLNNTTFNTNSGKYEDVSTTVQSNSSNWESTYNTFSSVSSTFLTTETESQILNFNEINQELSITNGNTVSLSSLIDDAGTDLSVRALTSNWEDTSTTVQSNSANWNYQGTDLKNLSGNWQTAYQAISANDLVRSNATFETPTTGISAINNLVTLTQETYDALTIKLPTTLYVII